jgi:hypothetical protein
MIRLTLGFGVVNLLLVCLGLWKLIEIIQGLF